MSNFDVFKAILAFIGVSFDEFIVLILFFARTHNAGTTWTTPQILLGHSMAFAVVVGISVIIGVVGGFIIPVELLGLLGIIPLWMGAHDLWKRIPRYYPNWRPAICCGCCGTTGPAQAPNRSQYTALSSQSTLPGEYGAFPAANGVEMTKSNRDEESGVDSNPDNSTNISQYCGKNMWLVFGAGLSEGSEEIAVFSALFSTLIRRDANNSSSDIAWWQSSSLVFTVILLFICLAIQLFVAYFLASSCARHLASQDKGKKSQWEIFLKLSAPALLVVLGVAVLQESVRYIAGY